MSNSALFVFLIIYCQDYYWAKMAVHYLLLTSYSAMYLSPAYF